MKETKETWVQYLGWGRSSGGEMATYSSILACKIRDREAWRLQSMRSKEVTHDWRSHTHTCMHHIYYVGYEQGYEQGILPFNSYNHHSKNHPQIIEEKWRLKEVKFAQDQNSTRLYSSYVLSCSAYCIT